LRVERPARGRKGRSVHRPGPQPVRFAAARLGRALRLKYPVRPLRWSGARLIGVGRLGAGG
jgi:hypothetical protein